MLEVLQCRGCPAASAGRRGGAVEKNRGTRTWCREELRQILTHNAPLGSLVVVGGGKG